MANWYSYQAHAENSETGRTIGSAQIQVYEAGTSTLATLASDRSGTSLTNPFNADAFGYFQFYAAAGLYDVVVSSGGNSQTFSDVALGPAESLDGLPDPAAARTALQLNNVRNVTQYSQSEADARFVNAAGDDMTGALNFANSDPIQANGNNALEFDANGNVTIPGNLDVGGTTTSFNTTNVDVEDPLIRLADGNTGTAIDIGVIGERGGSNVGVIWDESADEWAFVFTADDGSTTTVSISDYADLHVGALTVDDAITQGGNAVLDVSDLVENGGDVVQEGQTNIFTDFQVFNPGAAAVDVQRWENDTDAGRWLRIRWTGGADRIAMIPSNGAGSYAFGQDFSYNFTTLQWEFADDLLINGALTVGSPSGTAVNGEINAEALLNNGADVLDVTDLAANGGDVAQQNHGNTFTQDQTISNGVPNLTLKDPTDNNGRITFEDSGGTTKILQYSWTESALRYFSGGTERFRIEDTGDVGIKGGVPGDITGTGVTDLVLGDGTSNARGLVLQPSDTGIARFAVVSADGTSLPGYLEYDRTTGRWFLRDETDGTTYRILSAGDLAANGGPIPETDQDESVTGNWEFEFLRLNDRAADSDVWRLYESGADGAFLIQRFDVGSGNGNLGVGEIGTDGGLVWGNPTSDSQGAGTANFEQSYNNGNATLDMADLASAGGFLFEKDEAYTASDGDVLTWNNTAGEWEPQAPSGGGGGSGITGTLLTKSTDQTGVGSGLTEVTFDGSQYDDNSYRSGNRIVIPATGVNRIRLSASVSYDPDNTNNPAGTAEAVIEETSFAAIALGRMRVYSPDWGAGDGPPRFTLMTGVIEVSGGEEFRLLTGNTTGFNQTVGGASSSPTWFCLEVID